MTTNPATPATPAIPAEPPKPPKAVEMFDASAEMDALRTEFPSLPFKDLEGNQHELPNPYLMNPGEIRATLGLSEEDDIDEVDPKSIFRAFAPDALDAMERMPPLLQNRLIAAWLKSCGLELDEAGKSLVKSSEGEATETP